jgi:hypothetical protein
VLLRRIIGSCVAIAIVLAACGGNDDDGGGGSGGGHSPAEDQEIADAAIVAFESVLEGNGFTRSEDDDDDDDEPTFESEECRELEAAFGDEDELPGEVASAESDDFERDDFAQTGVFEFATASVGFVEDEEQLREILELMDEDFAECFNELLEKEIAGDPDEGVEIGDVRTDGIETSGVGDEAAAFGIKGNFAVQGIGFAMSFELEFVREGRAALSVMTAQVGAGDSRADRAELLQVLIDELDA